VGANRAPIRPRCKALVGRIPVEDGLRCRLQLRDQIRARACQQADREIDVLRASRLDVGGEEDLVASDAVDDLDARMAHVDREAVARAPRRILLESARELREYP